MKIEKWLLSQVPHGPEGTDAGNSAPASDATTATTTPAVETSTATGSPADEPRTYDASEESFDLDIPDDLDVVMMPQTGGTASDSSRPAAASDPVQPATAQPTTPEAPKVDVPPAAAAPASPEAPKVPSETPAPAASPQAGPAAETPKSFTELIDEGRGRIIDTLSSTKFALSQEEKDGLESGDSAVVPKMLSRVYVEAVRATSEIIEQALPNMVIQALAAREAQTSADTEFYSAHADLAPYRKDVLDTARVLRQLNPTMPKEQFVQQLVATVRVAKGLTGQPAAAPAAATPAPTARPSHAPVVSSVPSMSPAPQPGAANDWGDIDALMGQ